MDTKAIAAVFDDTVDAGLSWVNSHGGALFKWVRATFEALYSAIDLPLQFLPWYVTVLGFALLGLWLVSRSFAVFTLAGLALCWFVGLWSETMSTLALVVSSTLLALIISIPIGVIAGLLPRLDRYIEPVLDLIQTMPPYIYLLPAIALLGFGPGTALAATLIVAMPPAIRLTSLGIRMTPNEFIELGKSTGMTDSQMFTKIRLPFAIPSIMAGINQSLMMSFGMVVIAGIVGSGGLGQTIYEAIRTLDIAKSINAAIAIVVLTMMIDRMTQNLVKFGKAKS